MRQIGDDLKHDPKDVVVMEVAPQASMDSASNLAIVRQHAFNKFTEMSHKFCSHTLNLSSGQLSEHEDSRWSTCMNKYKQAFGIYQEESDRHFSALAAIEAAGGDKYEKLNQYDRF